jgi:hypothetical protein
MAALVPRYTAEEVRRFPDDGLRYEVIRGELFVSPAPGTSHRRARRGNRDHLLHEQAHRPPPSEYWIVDLELCRVERWRPADTEPEVITGRLLWRPAPDVPPFELDLVALFAATNA